jgi:hypothetical protein
MYVEAGRLRFISSSLAGRPVRDPLCRPRRSARAREAELVNARAKGGLEGLDVQEGPREPVCHCPSILELRSLFPAFSLTKLVQHKPVEVMRNHFIRLPNPCHHGFPSTNAVHVARTRAQETMASIEEVQQMLEGNWK